MNTKTRGLLALLGVICTAGSPGARADTAAYVQILSATVRDQKIDRASVTLQKNGEPSSVTGTDTAGRAPVLDALARDPASLLIVRKQGFSDLVAKCPCNGMTYALSPILERLDGMRIVLNWGRRPADLDGHLSAGSEHVFFLNKTGTDAQLDVDHTDGFGPETITIARKRPGQRYLYVVQDYTGMLRPASTDLSASDAKVFVYVGQTLIRTYYVPKGETGNLWSVFAVSEAGELQDINTFSGFVARTSGDLTSEKLFGAPRRIKIAANAPPSPDPPSGVSGFDGARRLNTQGELSYRQGDYRQAMALFQAAIEQDGAYGQAYSNLGLTFQRMGRVPEALWANRKAIALARGPSAGRTRAGTHFNNGRIYEEARQWNDALREFESAAREKSSPVYHNAIRRMREQGAR